MGIVLSQFQQTFPPKPSWSTSDIPDLTGKVVLITGGNASPDNTDVHGGAQELIKIFHS